MVYAPGLEPVFEAGPDLIDFVEVEPQVVRSDKGGSGHVVDERTIAQVARYPQAKLVHGVGFPLGGTRAPRPAEVGPFAEIITRLGSIWASEHLSFNRIPAGDGEFHAGFLLPPAQTAETVQIAADNIRAVQAQLPVPLAFETGVNYLAPRAGELSDGRFFAAVAEAADCGILLDLHNLWCNERNGRQPVLEVLAELPLDRVWEVHLAGGQDWQGYWLDAHSGPVPDELLEIAAQVLPALPKLGAITLEMMPEYLTTGRTTVPELLAQLSQLHELWRSTGRAATARQSTVSAPRQSFGGVPSTASWEDALGRVATGLPAGPATDTALSTELARDPGTAVLRELIGLVRAGTIVDTLPYTFRVIMLSCGEAGFRQALQDYQLAHPPEPLAQDEATAFAAFAKASLPRVVHLAEVTAYDLAVMEVTRSGGERIVQFSCDPTALLAALDAGRLPTDCSNDGYAVVITG